MESNFSSPDLIADQGSTAASGEGEKTTLAKIAHGQKSQAH
jgi:hypothetical protein